MTLVRDVWRHRRANVIGRGLHPAPETATHQIPTATDAPTRLGCLSWRDGREPDIAESYTRRRISGVWAGRCLCDLRRPLCDDRLLAVPGAVMGSVPSFSGGHSSPHLEAAVPQPSRLDPNRDFRHRTVRRRHGTRRHADYPLHGRVLDRRVAEQSSGGSRLSEHCCAQPSSSTLSRPCYSNPMVFRT